MSATIRVTIGLMMKASSQARKNVEEDVAEEADRRGRHADRGEEQDDRPEHEDAP